MGETNSLNPLEEEEEEADAFTREGLERAITDYNEKIQRFDVSPTSKQLLDPFTVACFIINRTIGGGIFAAPPIIFRGTGSVGASLVLWSVGGIVALCGVMCWLELGLTIPRHQVYEDGLKKKVSTPRSGGEKNYLEYIYDKPAFFMTCDFGIMFIVFGNVAFNAVAFGIYFMTAIDANYNPEDRGPVIGTAIIIMTICAIINDFSRKGGIWINNILAVGKILFLIIVAILGFLYTGGKLNASTIDNPSIAANNVTNDNFNPGTSFLVQSDPANYFGDIVHSFFYIVAPYTGFKQPFVVLSEVDRPRRVFPKVIIPTMLMVCVLYVLVNISYLCVVPHENYTLSRTATIDISSAFFNTIFNPGGDPDTIKRIVAAIIAVSIFGNIMIHTFSAGRLKQEIAKEGIIPFSLVFATGHETLWAKLLAYVHRDRGPKAIVDMENHPEQSPASAIWLHWMTTVILVGATATLPPSQQYMFLVYLYVYINQAIIGALVAGGLLYLKLDSFFNGKNGRDWDNIVAWKPWIDPLHAVVYFLFMGFIVFASLAKPSANSPFDKSVTGYEWWVVPVIGLSSLLFGVVWWYGLRILAWKEHWKLTVQRVPYIVKDKDGNYVQKVELVNHERIHDVPRRRNVNNTAIEMT